MASQPQWVRKNVDLLNGLVSKSEDFVIRVNQFYDNLALPTNLARPLPNSISHSFNGGSVLVNYNKFGFAEFGPHMTAITHNGSNFAKTYTGNWNTIVSSHSAARSKDLREATNWALKKDANGNLINFPNGRVRRATTASGNPSQSKIEILDDNGQWIEQTWHHQENGIDLMPVPSDIHNFLNHSGGFAAKHGSDGSALNENTDITELFNYVPLTN